MVDLSRFGRSAYHYGKYLVKTIAANQLFAGICFEKGIGPSAAEFFKTRANWIVQRTWIWDSFLAALSAGEFDRFVRKSQEMSGKSVDVIVSASMMSPQDSGKREESAYDALDNLPRQKIYYRVDNSKLSLLAEDSKAAKLIAAPGECQTLSELAAIIQNVKQADWVWINVEFGYLLSVEEAEYPWLTEAIWTNACEPFIEWFR